jgi:signal transduction histidine kinase
MRMRKPHLLHSAAVRLALGYALLFVVSSLVLVGFLWWQTTVYLNREIDAVILADAQAIADQLENFGVPGAVEAIDQRVARASDEHAIYLLADPMLGRVAGNLQAWPLAVGSSSGWHSLELVRGGKLRKTEALFLRLPDGFRLLVGRDVQERQEIRSVILDALGWACAGAMVLAVLGGLVVRRALLRRVETINRTAGAIVGGDFSRRVPTGGSSDEFDLIAQAINAMLAQIESLVARIRNATNSVAHDLRTPLAELRARLETLIRARPPAEAAFAEVQQAVSDIDRVIAVFNALLRLAEIESGARRAAFRALDLSDVAAEVGELYTPLAEEKGIAVTVEAPTGMVIDGDPDLLAQAMGNLVDNAIKYAPCGGCVSLRTAPDGVDRINVTVADNGPGIAAAEKPRVTEPFYRGNRSTGTEGTGVGLSIVEAVARLHAGRLMMTDNNPGLVVQLSLPRTTTRSLGGASSSLPTLGDGL